MEAPGGADLRTLRSVIVAGRVIEDRSLLAQYETPERGQRGHARFVVEPGNADEVSAAAKWAYHNRARLVIQGANTGLVGASTPDATGTQGLLRLGRLDEIADLSPVDRVVVVDAGVSLDVLNEALAVEGLFFPIEVGSNPSVGGLVATNAGGARTMRYGNVAARVLGVEAVVADEHGTRLGAVSKVGKDSSRLNLGRLFVGSYGALGVVTRVALRLAIVPVKVTTAFIALRSRHHALACLLELEGTFGESLSAFEFMSGEAVRLAVSNVPRLRRPFPEMEHADYVLVEVASHYEVDLDDRLAMALERLSTHVEAPLVDAVIAPPAHLWEIRHSLSEGVRGAGATVRFDVAVPRALLPVLHDRVEEAFRDDPARPLVTEFGHWAEGGTHLQLVYEGGTLPDDVEAVRTRVYSIVVDDLDGTFSAEHGLGPYNAHFYRRFIPPEEREMETRLKAIFDPRGVWGSQPFSVAL